MGREGARTSKFFVEIVDENKGANLFETYYTNIREKKKLIKEFERKIEELGACDETDYFIQYCNTLQIEIDELMELFRGRITSKKKKIIYIPMDINHAVDYLGFLINEGIDKHLDSIRNTMNAIEYETGTTKEDKNQMSYYKKLINHFKKGVPDIR